MDFKGSYRLPVPQQQAWDALNDPALLKAAIAGCERFEALGPDAWLAVVRATVGPISVTFRARLTLSEIEAPKRYTLVGEGQGGAAGFARLQAKIELTPDDGATRLDYDAQAEIGGKLASLGSRLMQSVVKRHTDAFFEALVAQLQPMPNDRTLDTADGVEPITSPTASSADPRAEHPAVPHATAIPRPTTHPLAAPAPAWLVVFGTAVGTLLGYCIGLLTR
ncbi:MAG: hypothetical protein RL322_1047 [Pseudomonadota bacterium]|jgi:carbon monoxide dehydrogenase subunit G